MARTKKVQENDDIEQELDEELELEVVEKKPRKSTKTATKTAAKTVTKKTPAKKSRSKKDADDDVEAELEINSDDEGQKAETQNRNRRPPREPVDASRPACDLSILDLLRYLVQRGSDENNPNPTLRKGASALLNELTRGPGRRRGGGGPRFGSKSAVPEDEPEQPYTRSRPRYGSKTAAVRHNPGQRQTGSKTNRRNRDGLY